MFLCLCIDARLAPNQAHLMLWRAATAAAARRQMQTLLSSRDQAKHK